jgi:hypothetical protein
MDMEHLKHQYTLEIQHNQVPTDKHKSARIATGTIRKDKLIH